MEVFVPNNLLITYQNGGRVILDMERKLFSKLENWKDKKKRKPLIIQGARQVGKTWIMKEFGKRYFKNTVYINFDNNDVMKKVFQIDFDISRIVSAIKIEYGKSFNANDTLIIFDEIQEAPEALASLKYFYENAPQYAIIAAGSLLGVALHQGTSFPVGKVDFMQLYPLDFQEFICALLLSSSMKRKFSACFFLSFRHVS